MKYLVLPRTVLHLAVLRYIRGTFRSPLSSIVYGTKAQRSRVVMHATMEKLGLNVTLPWNVSLDVGLVTVHATT